MPNGAIGANRMHATLPDGADVEIRRFRVDASVGVGREPCPDACSRFELVDSVISAALEIDIQGQYDTRRPNAQITRMDAPERCDEPVSFLATSWDADEDMLTHNWWVRGIGSFSGPLLTLPLPAGEHDVILTSQDPSGSFDSEVMRYARTCG